jgi:hypothetical protein
MGKDRGSHKCLEVHQIRSIFLSCFAYLFLCSPGYMLTKLTKQLLEQNPNLKVSLHLRLCAKSGVYGILQKQWEERTPMGRVGEERACIARFTNTILIMTAG